MVSMALYTYCRKSPAKASKLLVGMVKKQLEGHGVDVAKHFTPTYKPWDQRLCLVPNGDLFKALRKGTASVVTGHIDTFVENGIRLKDGQVIEADLIVTATGLKLKFLGGITLEVDGRVVEPNKSMAYKGMMFSDVPNLAVAIGYTNASWTLKCDLTCEYVCRLLRHMDEKGFSQCCPRRNPDVTEEPLINFTAGYIQRAIDQFPKQGSVRPWKLYQNYALDLVTLRHAPIEDGALEFRRSA
jgi:monooxygenase